MNNINGHEQFFEITHTPIPNAHSPIEKKPAKVWINMLLFVITVFTTTLAGAIMEPIETIYIRWFLGGIKFSAPLLLILGVHEMGHYVASRMHHVKATLPYFIPAPTFIGTFGAVIRIKEPIRDRKSLIDIGAAGPLAGFIIGLPILVWGVAKSEIIPIPEAIQGFQLGNSLILITVSKLIWGTIPEGYDIYLSAPAFAAWLGMFVTSLNLLPVGQLDGGHIAYALWGKGAYRISKIVFFALFPLGYFWPGWIFWALLVFFILRLKHPPLNDMNTPLDEKRIMVGYICLFIFIITFIPVPFSL